jgi:hypothetical protein
MTAVIIQSFAHLLPRGKRERWRLVLGVIDGALLEVERLDDDGSLSLLISPHSFRVFC